MLTKKTVINSRIETMGLIKKIQAQKVHRLVARHFYNKGPDKGPSVNHKDGNKQNNNVKNLEWVTTLENNPTWL